MSKKAYGHKCCKIYFLNLTRTVFNLYFFAHVYKWNLQMEIKWCKIIVYEFCRLNNIWRWRRFFLHCKWDFLSMNSNFFYISKYTWCRWDPNIYIDNDERLNYLLFLSQGFFLFKTLWRDLNFWLIFIFVGISKKTSIFIAIETL